MSKEEKLTQELLIVIDKDNASALYSISDSVKGFNSYLMSEKSLIVQRGKIKHDGNEFDYSVKRGKVKSKSQKFFNLVLKSPHSDIETFKKMLRELKTVINQENIRIETLQDDISRFYSQEGYSIIYSIENLMRKFITYFMITNVGKDWIHDSPDIIRDALSKSKRKQQMDQLHQLDFIQLGDFLFKKYQSVDEEKSFEKLSQYTDNGEISLANVLSDIQKAVPRSNWDRHFKSIVNQSDEYLKVRWRKLYEFRNRIAHTSTLSDFDLNEIEIKVNEVGKVLNDAFKNIDVIELEEQDRLSISEGIAIDIDQRMELFFNELEELEQELRALDKDNTQLPIDKLVEKLKSNQVLDSETTEKIKELINTKSSIVFSGDPSNNRINELNAKTTNLKNKLRSTWITDVYSALERLGGTASLKDIYKSVREVSDRDFPDSWETSVRKTLYTHSSDTDIYNGINDLFKKKGRGQWMIRKDPPRESDNI